MGTEEQDPSVVRGPQRSSGLGAEVGVDIADDLQQAWLELHLISPGAAESVLRGAELSIAGGLSPSEVYTHAAQLMRSTVRAGESALGTETQKPELVLSKPDDLLLPQETRPTKSGRRWFNRHPKPHRHNRQTLGAA